VLSIHLLIYVEIKYLNRPTGDLNSYILSLPCLPIPSPAILPLIIITIVILFFLCYNLSHTLTHTLFFSFFPFPFFSTTAFLPIPIVFPLPSCISLCSSTSLLISHRENPYRTMKICLATDIQGVQAMKQTEVTRSSTYISASL